MKSAAIKRLIAVAMLCVLAPVLAGCHCAKRGDVKPVSSAAPAHATDSKNA